MRRIAALALLLLTPAAARAQRAVLAADSSWRGSFSMVERLEVGADSTQALDGERRRAAVGMQVNVSHTGKLVTERIIRLEGTIVPRTTLDGTQRAALSATFRSSVKGTETMPTRVRCTTNGSEISTTIVRRTEQQSEGSAEVEDELTATNLGISVVIPEMRVQTRTVSDVTGEEACGVEGEGEQRAEFEHDEGGERVGIDIAPDPRNPDVSIGSKVERVTPWLTRTWVWAFERGPKVAELALDEVMLEHHVFPDADRWVPIGPKGTVDGNRVRIRMTVSNDGPQGGGSVITIRDMAAKRAVTVSPITVYVEAKGRRTVEFEWDTQGWAWEPGPRAMSGRQLEVRLQSGAPGRDRAEVAVIVAPKPVILVHGLWSDASTWRNYAGFVREAHSFAWRAFAVGDGAVGDAAWTMHTGVLGPATLLDETNSIFQNASILARYLKAVRAEMNAWHVDLVGHSMGGLISRLFLTLAPPSPDGRPVVRHLIMLGTPNLGSPCSVPLDFLGDARVEAYRQLTPEVAEAFNMRVRDVSGVRYAILAGDALPKFPCADGPFSFTANDGVVALPSAFAWYHDRQRSRSLHTDMTGSAEDFRAFVLPRLAEPPAGW